MALAPDVYGPSPAPSADAASLNLALLSLSNLIGAGVVRISDGLTWSLNAAATPLLEAIGGSNGGSVPPAIVACLAAENGLARVEEAMSTTTPESRHITIATLREPGIDLVVLRDHTEERLLQERLLQSEKMASVG